VGIPYDEDPWGWSCGSIQARIPGNALTAAPTFDQARADFEAAWQAFLSKRTKADFQAWRHARDWAQKYAMWARGEKLPSQKPRSLMTRPCGVRFDSHRLEHNLVHVPRATE